MHCAEDRQARMQDNWSELPATLRRKRRPKMCQARLDEFYMSDSEIDCCARHLEANNQQPLDKFNINEYVTNNKLDKVSKSVNDDQKPIEPVIICETISDKVPDEINLKENEDIIKCEKEDKPEDEVKVKIENKEDDLNIITLRNNSESSKSDSISSKAESEENVQIDNSQIVSEISQNVNEESAIESKMENITLVCVITESNPEPKVPSPPTTTTMTRHSTLIAISSDPQPKESSDNQILDDNNGQEDMKSDNHDIKVDGQEDMKKEINEDITKLNDIDNSETKENSKIDKEECENNDQLSSNECPSTSEDVSSVSESHTATANDKSDMELFLKSAVSADSLMGSGGEDAASSGSSNGFEPVHDDSGTDEPSNELPVYSIVSKSNNNKSILYDSVPVEIPRAGLHRRHSMAEREALAFYDSLLPVLSDDEDDESNSKETDTPKAKPSLVEFKLPRVVRNARKRLGTIVEETSSASLEAEKMTVRDLLRRFEQISANKNGDGSVNIIDEEEKSATLRDIQNALKSLEEKVRKYESKMQHKSVTATVPVDPADSECGGGGGPRGGGWGPTNRISPPPETSPPPSSLGVTPIHDGKHSLLQYALLHFRQTADKFDMLKAADGGIAAGSLQALQSLKAKRGGDDAWTWKEQVDLVKFTSAPIEQSLLRLDSSELNGLAVECFEAVMRYMGDLPLEPHLSEVECVYTILMHCHKHVELRDEVYCQLMKQTTSNRSPRPDSAQRGWRLLSIVAAYFACSDTLRPYLFKYLETAAYDSRRACHGTAMVCLSNLRKTLRHGGRKNVPSVEELTAVSAGRNSKRQIYRLPGGSERVVNTRSTTVVADVIEEICNAIGVRNPHETEEFSLYCIVEGDAFTMPLARDEYILDVTTELHKNQQVFYLIFCRSVWHFQLRLDVPLYVEVVFNQIAPDYLEGLLLVMPGEQLAQEQIYELAKLAALLHRAADLTHMPTMKETKFLLPKPALSARDVKPAQWVHMVQGSWPEIQDQTATQAKAQVLETLSHWPLFGSSFFAVKRTSDPKERGEHILALNRHGVHFIDLVTHETLLHYQFAEVISTRKVKSEDGTLFLDMKCGNLMQQRITRLQTDQAHEISRLIRQYITLEQRLRNS